MDQSLGDVQLFHGLQTGQIRRLEAIARSRTLHAGEYLFLLGDNAQYFYAVMHGEIELCFPFSMGGVIKDVVVETVGPGRTVGWSALVKPFRFTLSARAATAGEILAFARHDLLQVFDADPGTARVVLAGISDLVATRLSMFQALWARELHRTLGGDPTVAGSSRL